jgi:molybdate transport system permease protein
MLAGNIPGRTQTASVAIYDAVQAGRIEQATSLALALAIVAGAALLLLARVGRGARW